MYQTNQRRQVILWSSLGVGLLLVVGGLFFWLSSYQKATTKALPFADALVLWKDNKIVALEEGKEDVILGEWEIEAETVVANRFGDKVYVVTKDNPRKLYELSLTNDTFNWKEKYQFEYNFTPETALTVEEDSLTLYESQSQQFTWVNSEFLKTKTLNLNQLITSFEEITNESNTSLLEGTEIILPKGEIEETVETEASVENQEKAPLQVESWHSSDDMLYVSINHVVYAYNWFTGETTGRLDLEDETVQLWIKDNSVFAVNEFGLDSNYYAILKLEPNHLAIEALEKITVTDPTFYLGLKTTDEIYYQTVDSKSKALVITNYSPNTFKSNGPIAPAIEESDQLWFANNFVYIVRESGEALVYSTFSTNPLYQSTENVQAVYPIWNHETLQETLAETEMPIEKETLD